MSIRDSEICLGGTSEVICAAMIRSASNPHAPEVQYTHCARAVGGAQRGRSYFSNGRPIVNCVNWEFAMESPSGVFESALFMTKEIQKCLRRMSIAGKSITIIPRLGGLDVWGARRKFKTESTKGIAKVWVE